MRCQGVEPSDPVCETKLLTAISVLWVRAEVISAALTVSAGRPLATRCWLIRLMI
jgi:hypothetical protein